MQVTELKQLVHRRPFRPFSIRLNNGASYSFADETKVGAPEDFHIIVYFGPKEAVLIDTESIVEVTDPR